MTRSFKGKVVVITGGSSGIGLAAARAFSENGATIFISGRRQTALDEAVAAIGGDVTAVQADMAKLADIDRLYETVLQRHRHIDVLFANAGGGELQALGDITEEHFDTIFATNVKGTLFTVQKALPMIRKGSSIILTGSTTSVTGTPAFSVYSATKAAVRNFARSWILDLKGRGIRVNIMSPGPTETPGLVQLAGDETSVQQQFLDQFANNIPLGRVGKASEIAQAVLFLASDDASFVNGVELFVDGGMSQF